jgi:hypothetical protein
MLEGGCFCGQVRYEVDGVPFNSTVCHCSDCRRIAAAPVVAWFTARLSDFRFTADQPSRFASSEKVIRSFCPTCGTPLTYQNQGLPDEIDVSTCSLDNPVLLPPQDHVLTAEKLSWIQISDGLPQYSGSRDKV